MRTILYVDHLKSHEDVGELERLFARHGVVIQARVFNTPDLFSRYGGFGIIEMGSHPQAKAALAALHGAAKCGTVLAVRWATAREQRASGRPRILESMNLTDAGNARRASGQ